MIEITTRLRRLYVSEGTNYVQDMTNRWQCNACAHKLAISDMLSAPSPFDKHATLYACPECLQCDKGFSQLCDAPKCNQEATCGWPTTDGGYRRTCGNHMELTK